MTLIDPVVLTVEVLKAAGHADVNSDRIEARALSSQEYIFVQEQTGRIPHIKYSDRPSISLILYSNEGFNAARQRMYTVLEELQAAQGQAFESGGIHRVITVLRPGRSDVAGLPQGVGRVSAQADLILSNREKWS
jgi:hypothetical protein